MLPSQTLASLDQLWFAAAKNCSVHSSTCSLHNTQQRRKGQGRLLHQKSRAGHADGGAGEKVNVFTRSYADGACSILKAAMLRGASNPASKCCFKCCHQRYIAMAIPVYRECLFMYPLQDPSHHQDLAEELLKADPAAQAR
jgi:hypothetical protein